MTAAQRPERLHKVLAHAGVASRRRCEEYIRDGRVRVNGELVRQMGVLVDLSTDVVEVDGERIRPERPVHLLLYKPRDCLCTTSDQFGRKTILDLLPAHRRTRLFTVGRLDFESEGLIVVTNDGDFAHEVLHPRRRLPRTYYVKVRGNVTQEQIDRAREGVWLSDGRTPPMDVRLLRAGREVSTLKCTLVERHHHELRRIWAKLGLPVLRLVLVRIASIGTEDLKKGTARTLTAAEVEDLRSGPPGQIGEGHPSHTPQSRERRRPAGAGGRRPARAGAKRDGGGGRREGDGARGGKAGRGWGSKALGEESREPRGRRGARHQRGRTPSDSSSSGVRFRKRGR